MRVRGWMVIGLVVASLWGVGAPIARAAGSSSPPPQWRPGPASYGISITKNVPVTMSDGVVLRVDIRRPADPKTGKLITGRPFPVLLTQTPYGKSPNDPAGSGPDDYLVSHGYIQVVADIRGTGASEGTFEAFGTREIQDGVELVKWSSQLSGSTGNVGLQGCSYLGINQLLTGEAVGPHSALKAIFPQDASNSNFRDLSDAGGMPSLFGAALGSAILPPEFSGDPVVDYTGDPGDTSLVEGEHAGYFGFLVGNQVQTQTGTPSSSAYYNKFWDLRDPGNHLDRIVANDIPTFLQGGLFDLFQRGETMNYAGLQNAYAGRKDWWGPMRPGQPVSGKFQLIDGPWYHCDGDQSGPTGSSVDIEALQLRWFDRWLKNDHNGIDQTRTPLHIWEEGANRWVDTDVWPVAASSSTYYLGAGTLSTTRPKATTGADAIAWDDASGPCATTVPALTASSRCASDDSLMQAGPHALTYTADVGGKTLAGPVDATIYLTDTTTDAELGVTIDDVGPDGKSAPVTGGILLGSFRAVDPQKSWTDGHGNLLAPYHPYSADSVQALTRGKVERLDIEVFGTMWRFAPGHKLRVTLNTSSTPWALPTAAEIANLAGGLYQVQRNRAAASFLDLPLISTASLPPGCPVCIPPA